MIAADWFRAAPIRSPGGHGRPFAETDRWLTRLSEVIPVTRVYDAAPLDHLDLPVWGAVTPLARDLTVHAGKGETPVAARISAVMEAVERVSAEQVDATRTRKASYAQVRSGDGEGVVDPVMFDLPFQTTYRPDRSISWVEGYDLQAGTHAWVPVDVVVSPAVEGVCVGVDTNGLAAGNSHTEAALHALLEVIERDADAHDQFASIYADDGARPRIRLIDPASLPEPAAGWVGRLHDAGSTTTIRKLSHDLDVPVFRATIADRSFPGREGKVSRFDGLGCDLDGPRAVFRAVSEAVQSHTAVLVGARDTFEREPRGSGIDAAGLVGLLSTRSSIEPFCEEGADDLPNDLYDRLLLLLDRLARAGLRKCIVVDLTRPELSIPVVRVLVPGLSGPYGNTPRRPPLRLLRSLLQWAPPKRQTRNGAALA